MAEDNTDNIPLEESAHAVGPSEDRRPRLPEPIPVELVAVNDIVLRGVVGQEANFDAFYADLLRFVKQPTLATGRGKTRLVYEADNFLLHVDLSEQPEERSDYRPATVVVPNLGDIERQLIERELEYTRQRGLTPGDDRLALQDPGGNWVEVKEYKSMR